MLLPWVSAMQRDRCYSFLVPGPVAVPNPRFLSGFLAECCDLERQLWGGGTDPRPQFGWSWRRSLSSTPCHCLKFISFYFTHISVCLHVCMSPRVCSAHRGQSCTGGSWLRGPWASDESMSLLELAEHKEKVRSDYLNISVALAVDTPVCTGLNSKPRDQ